MSETRKVLAEVKNEPEEVVEDLGGDLVTELTITLTKSNGINLHVKEGTQMQALEIEMLIRNVYEQLHENRIAQMAVEVFKSKF